MTGEKGLNMPSRDDMVCRSRYINAQDAIGDFASLMNIDKNIVQEYFEMTGADWEDTSTQLRKLRNRCDKMESQIQELLAKGA
jgi:hypothetical protein